MSVYRTLFLTTFGTGLTANTPSTIMDNATATAAVLPLGACVHSVTIFNNYTSTSLATGVGISLGTLSDLGKFVALSDGLITTQINDSQIMFKSVSPSVGMTDSTLIYITLDTDFDDSGTNQIAFYVNYVMTEWVDSSDRVSVRDRVKAIECTR